MHVYANVLQYSMWLTKSPGKILLKLVHFQINLEQHLPHCSLEEQASSGDIPRNPEGLLLSKSARDQIAANVFRTQVAEHAVQGRTFFKSSRNSV